MKIAFVQTYPIYHDLNLTTSQWLEIENRDKWMPAILNDEGHEVELWGVSDRTSEHDYNRESFSKYSIRLFKPSKYHSKTKKDYSDELVDHAKQYAADLLFLKGVDGGAGLRLLEEYALPRKKPFVFIIGGKYYNRYVPKASAILYETVEQKERLMHPGMYFLRQKIPQEKLFMLPKSVDTDLFKPSPEIPVEFDLISAGRLIPKQKNYSALGELSEVLNVALVGDGPLRHSLSKSYPKLHILGPCPHSKMPQQLNKARAFMHSGTREFFPRVIPEAMATGLPCIAFREVISEEVIPDDCGLLVAKDAYVDPVCKLLADGDAREEKLATWSKHARSYILSNFGIDSSRAPMQRVLDYLKSQL